MALVERSLRLGGELLGVAPQLLLHGGGALELLPLLPEASYRPSLVLDGLARWAVHQPAAGR